MTHGTITDLRAWECANCGRVNAHGCRWCLCGNERDRQQSPANPLDGLAAQRHGDGDVGATRATPGHRRGAVGREAELQRACEQWLTSRGIEYLHLSPRAREHKGWPDLTFAVAGRPCAVELKNATGKCSQEQIECLARLARDGWMVAVHRDLRAFAEWTERQERQAKEATAWQRRTAT